MYPESKNAFLKVEEPLTLSLVLESVEAGLL